MSCRGFENRAHPHAPHRRSQVKFIGVMSGIKSTGTGFSALDSERLGINRGLANLKRDASTIASATAPESLGDLTTALVDLPQQRLYVAMAARAMSITDKALG